MDDVTATTTPPDGASAAADADSVRRTLGGEVAAFDQLIERYQRRVVGLAYRLVGNSHEAADIAQDAFLRAFRSLATLQEVERFGP